MAKYGIVIPSLYEVDGPYLKLCVESLRESGFDGQIIVVTNGGRTTQPIERGAIEGISTHVHTRQQGQCNAVNIGAQYLEPDTEFMMVSNADMYYAPGWNKYISKDEDWSNLDKIHALVFSPNLIEPTNNPGSAPPFLKLDAGLTIDDFQLGVVDEFVKEKIKEGKDTPYMGNKFRESGFNLPFFIRKDVWQTIGGFDTKYDPWGSNSDTDLQTAINLAGITPIRLRDVLVYHFSNKSGTFDGTHQEDWQRNWDYFNRKWGFNRDDLGSDVWYNKDMLPEDYDQVKFKPDWIMKYV